jgi:hypothetical protein
MNYTSYKFLVSTAIKEALQDTNSGDQGKIRPVIQKKTNLPNLLASIFAVLRSGH